MSANPVEVSGMPRSFMLLRHDWRVEQVEELLALPFAELMFRAQQTHRARFDPNEIQISSLLSVKTGACAEDCAYCPQSAHYHTEVERQGLMALDEVLQIAEQARQQGATRFCMGGAWRAPRDRDVEQVAEMVVGVKRLGLETCVTLGMLSDEQVLRLKHAGLDYYNHNLDTSPEFYPQVISTRTYQDRLDTLERVRTAGIHVCCGGILGMGESVRDRAGLLVQLANLEKHPESVPINMLVRVEGTPLAEADAVDPFDFVRTIAAARIMMPLSRVRLSAGRAEMSDELQALCFLAGANSIFYGERLLTTPNAQVDRDRSLFKRLGLRGAGSNH